MLDHKHIIVNANVRKPILTTEDAIDWLRRLVQVAKMKLIIGPHAHYCTQEGNEGVAAVCAIETSHASIHVWDKTNPPHIRFDLYSCSTFKEQDILTLVEEFDPIDYDWICLDRNEKIKVNTSGEFIGAPK